MNRGFMIVGLLLTASLGYSNEQRVEFQGIVYQTYTVAPERLSLFWLGPNGKPFHQFSTLQRYLESRSSKIAFLMNAGIFEPGGIPSGLLVIDHQIQRPLNQANGQGNFYLQPNGGFSVEGSSANILTTPEYARLRSIPRLAIQSGPLLLRAGKRHPAFQKQSTNYLHRNGVGILADGRVVFAITEFDQSRFPNLYEFAEFFRSLGCRDALFLDGDISQSVVNPVAPITPGNHFGALFGVVE